MNEDFKSWSEELHVLATDICSNISRASTSAMVPSTGGSAVSTDGDTVTCSK